jgi:hypothetical protein
LVTADEELAAMTGARPSGLLRLLRAASDALMLFAVLAFSAVAIIAIAVAAPLALAVSAAIGALAPAKDIRQTLAA